MLALMLLAMGVLLIGVFLPAQIINRVDIKAEQKRNQPLLDYATNLGARFHLDLVDADGGGTIWYDTNKNAVLFYRSGILTISVPGHPPTDISAYELERWNASTRQLIANSIAALTVSRPAT